MGIVLWGLACGVLGLAGALLLGAAGGAAWLPVGVVLLLPAAGLGALLQQVQPHKGTVWVGGLGALLWGGLVVVGAPTWLDREAALHQTLPPAWASWLHARLPATRRSVPVQAVAAAAAAGCDCGPETASRLVFAPVVMGEGGEVDLVVLPYEGSAASMRVPLSLELNGAEAEAELLFDTGASLTSLSPAVLDALGYTVPRGAPTVTMQTANGLRESPLFVVDRLWLGGLPVEGVTAVLCDNCGELSGLLGLNVSSTFRVEVDQVARELQLEPVAQPNRHLDVRPWLSLSLASSASSVVLVAESRAPRPISALEVSLHCGDTPVGRVALPALPAHGRAEAPLEEAPPCRRVSLQVEHARW